MSHIAAEAAARLRDRRGIVLPSEFLNKAPLT